MALRRNDLLVLTVAIVAVVGVALVAASLGSLVFHDVNGFGGEPPIGEDPPVPWSDRNYSSNGGGGGDLFPNPPSMVVCIDALTHPGSIIGIFAGLFGLLYLIAIRMNFSAALLSGSFLLPMTMLAYFLLTNCPGGRSGIGDPLGNGNGDDPGWLVIEGVPSLPAELVGLLVLGTLIVAVSVLYSMSSHEDHQDELEMEPAIAEPDAADFAMAARRARERIEQANVPVDNAVYQAWLEMTGLLAIERPETTAPREFAEAAIDLGMAEADVSELTNLFNEVRYGERDPETREERAIAVLRNIEETYVAEQDTGSVSP